MGKYCGGCPLEGKGGQLNTKGNNKGNILFVTDRPDENQIHRGLRFPDYAIKIFNTSMSKAGVNLSQAAYHPHVKCFYKKDEYSTKEKKEIFSHCRRYLLDRIDKLKPDCVIPTGADAAKMVAGRAVKITKARGIPEYMTQEVSHEDKTYENTFCNMPMLSPTQIAVDPAHLPTFDADCSLLKVLQDNEYDSTCLTDKEGNADYILVDDLQFIVDADYEDLAFDLETIGVRSYAPDAKIMTMQFCWEEGKAYTLSWDHPEDPKTRRQKLKLKNQLRQILQNPDTNVLGQNLKFDQHWMLRHLNIRFRAADDTIMLAACIDENSPKNMDDLVKRFVPSMAGYADEFNNKYDKSRMDLVPLLEIVQYGGGDADATLRLFNILYPMVDRDHALLRHYRHVSMPSVNMFVMPDFYGMNIDEQALDLLEGRVQTIVDGQENALLAQIPQEVLADHVEKGLKFSRADFVRDILFQHPKGFKLKPIKFTKSTEKLDKARQLPSTSSKDHLPYFFDDCPFTMELAEFQKNNRLLGTNIKRFRENYMTEGKVYPIYDMFNTTTGRSSSRDPNGQNIPKRGTFAKPYRDCFVADPGWTILEADYSQAELRIAADMANERTMIQIYREGGDIHRATALIVMGVKLEEFLRQPSGEQKLARFKAKAVNFGFLYGMWWKSFVGYAKTQYGAEFTDREAEKIREDFFKKYSGLKDWHERVEKSVLRTEYVRSYTGRIRHLPSVKSREDYKRQEAVRLAVNAPVQECASSLGTVAMARLEQEIDHRVMKPSGFVHDALYFQVRNEYIEWGAKTIKHYMETNPIEEMFGVKLKLPMVADVGFGRSMNAYEMETLTLDDPYDFTIHDEYDEEGNCIKDVSGGIPEQLIPVDEGRVTVPEHMIYLIP